MGKKPYYIQPERSRSGYSVIAHTVKDETCDPTVFREEIVEILVQLVRLARRRGRPRLKESA